MTNEKLVLSIVPADNLTAYNCALEVARRKDEEYKILLDTQPISELGGWQTEPPTKDCTVLLYITEQTLTVSRWNSPNKKFYDNVYFEPINEWIKWKLI